MKIIKLYSMVLENFKGISKLEAVFNGKDVKVYGDNGTGKTTLFDAFLFVLFGKDSKGNKNFAIKTIIDGEEVHNVDHSVSVKLEVDGEIVELKRVYKEVYKKGKTAAEKIFSGHKTFYYVNDVPLKDKEYKEKIDSIVSEDIFKLITNPNYFNELDWKEQRKILFELSNGIEFDPLEKNKELALLKDLLNKHSFNEALVMYKAKSKRAKQEIESIPTRIDELNNSINEYKKSSSNAEEDIAILEKEIDSLKEQIHNLENGQAANKAKKDLYDLKHQRDHYKNELKQNHTLEVNKLITKLEEVQGNGQIIQNKFLDLSSELNRINFNLQSKDDEIVAKDTIIQKLRYDFNDISKKQFNLDDYINVCKTCNRPLDEMDEEEALLAFILYIKKSKEEINDKGIIIKEELNKLKEERNQILESFYKKEEELEKQKQMLEKAKKEKFKFESKINELRNNIIDLSQYEILIEMNREISIKQEELEAISSLNKDMINDLYNQIDGLKLQKESLNMSLSKKYAAIEAQKRIDELNYKLKDLLLEFDDAERHIYLLEQYNREKVENLSQSINGLFSITEFKLFKKLVNGEYEETCESLHDNVPYGKGLNTAARINVGLDIINVLCDHYQVSAPIFVDNAESCTNILQTKGQKICMYVKEGQKTLEFKENE